GRAAGHEPRLPRRGRAARRGGHLPPAPRCAHLGLLGPGHPGRAGLAAAARLSLPRRVTERPTAHPVHGARWTGQHRPTPARRPRPSGEIVATYAVQYTYIDDADRVAIYRPEHREHLAELHREGTLLLSGPLGDGPGALLIVVADSVEDALAKLDGDPFKRERVIVDRVAREWTVVIGELPGAEAGTAGSARAALRHLHVQQLTRRGAGAGGLADQHQRQRLGPAVLVQQLLRLRVTVHVHPHHVLARGAEGDLE